MNATWINLDEIFAWVARASLYAVAVIAVIVSVQTLARRVLAAKWIFALWAILLLRLAIPAGPASNWSLWNLNPQRWTQQMFSGPDLAPTVSEGLVTFAPSAAGNEAALLPNKEFSSRSTLRTFLPGVWLAGALFIMCGIIIGNLRLWNTVRRLPFVTDHAILELFEECRQSMRVRTMVGLVVTERVNSPILFGFIRPRILLPADLARGLPPERLRYILLHELAHLKRRDILTGWIFAFLQALHWFNPLVWWAFGRIRFDRELACDEQVLSRIPSEERRYYGDVLIEMLERFNHIQHLPAIAGILENKDQLKRRLVMIRKFRLPARREIITATALLAVLSIALLTEPRSVLSQSEGVSASLVGTIYDASGEVVPGATVTTINTDTGVYTRTVTNNSGVYIFPSLQIGTYEVTVEAQDFTRSTRNNVGLGGGTQARLDFSLAIAGTVPEVETTGMDDSVIPGQGVSASLVGAIYDASGEVVPGTTVTATNTDTGVYTRTVTNNSGVYIFPSLQIGTYEVTVEAQDFTRSTGNNVRLGGGTQARLDFSVAITGTVVAIAGTLVSIAGTVPEVESADFKPPEVLVETRPGYTAEARDAKIQGTVVLKAVIRKDGTVDNAEVLKGLGYGLDEAAVDTVTEWRFRPATLDGVPVNYLVFIEISFNIW